MSKCIVCKEPATSVFSPDLDIAGIGACNKHSEVVGNAYVVLVMGDEELFWRLVRKHRDYKK